uniref:Transmembrane protein n=1 Tax=Kalanchoe fedtschenkoi TaxID=63787 RepID=A0A7N1A4M6_KALFE
MSRIVVFSVVVVLTFVTDSRAQERSPHGLAYENPVAYSPAAYDFFHPDAGQSGSNVKSCSKSGCSPLPLAAHFESNQAHESHATLSQRRGGLGAKAITAIVSGMAFAVLLGMGAYYVVTTRRANNNRANSVQPDA